MAHFECWEDCQITGCPGHDITVGTQNSVNHIQFFEDGRRTPFLFMDENKFKAIVKAYIEARGVPA